VKYIAFWHNPIVQIYTAVRATSLCHPIGRFPLELVLGQ